MPAPHFCDAVREVCGVDAADRYAEIQRGAGWDDSMPPIVTFQNLKKFIRCWARIKLTETLPRLQSLRAGLSVSLPVELLPLFSPKELEMLFCGASEIDVDMLKQVAKYSFVNPDKPHIKYFWEVLEGFTQTQRAEFLNFCWSRSRLPLSIDDFLMPFKIEGADASMRKNADEHLPTSQTCFFSIKLPPYSCAAVLREKLLYAIKNSPTMDADHGARDAPGFEELL